MDVYHWGDRFFNGYDSAYVSRTYTNFNVRANSDSWLYMYTFDLPDDVRIRLGSEPASSAGISLSYLAVSVGYDVNVSRFIGGSDRKRDRFSFGFNCSLLSFEFYKERNNGGTSIRRFGDRKHQYKYNIDFPGINTLTEGFDLYIFFNQLKYSSAAAFNYGRYQLKSQGSFYAGISYFYNDYDFDFSTLPIQMRDMLPADWEDYRYTVNTHNYCLRVGYGYNWVLNKHWIIGITESPVLGLQQGYITGNSRPLSVSFSNRARLSIVWNSGKWFAGVIGNMDQGLIYNKRQAFMSHSMSMNACVGYRFNLW